MAAWKGNTHRQLGTAHGRGGGQAAGHGGAQAAVPLCRARGHFPHPRRKLLLLSPSTQHWHPSEGTAHRAQHHPLPVPPLLGLPPSSAAPSRSQPQPQSHRGRQGGHTFTFPSSFTLLLRSSRGLERAESEPRVSVLPWQGLATLSGVKDDTSLRTPWCGAGLETGEPETE